MITQDDKDFLRRKGISEEQIDIQLNQLEKGFPFLRLSAAASTEKGIITPTAEERSEFLDIWNKYISDAAHKVIKFVPASGAASRMFKNLFEFIDGESEEPKTEFERKFFTEIRKFAFFDALSNTCEASMNQSAETLIARGCYKDVARTLLNIEGLNYGSLPKCLLLFHKYEDSNRTPLEEHLAEAALYTSGKSGKAYIHFTISAEHKPMFDKLVARKAKECAKRYGVDFDISFSYQKPSTDTIAVTPEGEPFRDDDGKLLFRPGGHGALIENLNDLEGDIVFIKTVDNVMPDKLKSDTIEYKKLLAGILISLQTKINEYLQILDSGVYSMNELREMLQFLQKKLFTKNPETKHLEDTELAIYLKGKFNRPIRVCGMVRNVGEPGGGPFLAYNNDGTISLQILESSQIDMTEQASKEMFEKSTHFNPVDLVCSLKNYKGEKFNLPDFVDKNTGFISKKSKNGRDLKALELPGLWNGAMSNWNTVFVEVPLSTFAPVKTVNDLLREQHQ